MSRSNFDHFNNIKVFRDIVNRMKRAEDYRHNDIESSIINCRKALELIVQWVFDHDAQLQIPFENNLFSMLEDQNFRSNFKPGVLQRMDSVRKLGNRANHETDTVNITQAEYCIESMFVIMDSVSQLYVANYNKACFNHQLFQNPDLQVPVVTPLPSSTIQANATAIHDDTTDNHGDSGELTADIVNSLLGENICTDQMTKSELEELLSYMDEGDKTLTDEQKECVNFTPRSDLVIKGTAGSGKSIILMQRAIKLRKRSLKERTPKNILILTYTNALVSSLRQTIGLALENNEYINIRTLDSAAAKVYAGIYGFFNRTIDRDNNETRLDFIEKAKEAVRKRYPNSRIPQLANTTLDEEIQWIKGNMLHTVEAYRQSGRSGRGGSLRMSETDYAVSFEIYAEYNKLLKEAGVIERLDLFDKLIKTPDQIPEKYKFDYVLIDEAQDLQPIILRFAKLISKESITIACDSAQKIYSGSFTLRDLGIDIRGRASKSLSNAFRNTREISMLASNLYSIIKEKESGDPNVVFTDPSATTRSGSKPVFCQCGTLDLEQKCFTKLLTSYLKEKSLTIGVLYRSKDEREILKRWMQDAKIEDYQLISGWHGRDLFYKPIRLCSMHSAKGLEFDVVILPLFQKSVIPAEESLNKLDDSEKEELFNQERKLVYVSFTRAKEKLVVSFTGEPSIFLRELAEDNYELWNYSLNGYEKIDRAPNANCIISAVEQEDEKVVPSEATDKDDESILDETKFNARSHPNRYTVNALIGRHIRNNNNNIVGIVKRADDKFCYISVQNGPNLGKKIRIPTEKVIKWDSHYTVFDIK